MKKSTILTAAVLSFFFAAGCSSFSLFKEKITIEDVIAEQTIIEAVQNPAKKQLLLSELENKKTVITGAVVKDVIESEKIGYSFCVLTDISASDKKIECQIYSHNVKVMAKLEKNRTVINATGTFERFFTTLDEYTTKVEITDADIEIQETEDK